MAQVKIIRTESSESGHSTINSVQSEELPFQAASVRIAFPLTSLDKPKWSGGAFRWGGRLIVGLIFGTLVYLAVTAEITTMIAAFGFFGILIAALIGTAIYGIDQAEF